MPDGKKDQKSNLPWLALLGLVAAGVTTALYFSPLTSSRPPEPADRNYASLGYQNVIARLWQDPFKAVNTSLKTAAATQPSDPNLPRHDRKELRTQIQYQLDNHHDVLILPVMVPSAPYSELAEHRLRTRVAVLEGLAGCGLLPVDGEHIGYTILPWMWLPPKSEKEPTASITYQSLLAKILSDEPVINGLPIPYEWCEQSPLAVAGKTPNTNRFDRVLILWLSEEAMNDQPLARLAAIKHALMDNLTPKPATRIEQNIPPPRQARFKFTVVGPRVSTTLRAIVTELCNSDPASLHEELEDARMFAATPTAEEKTLLAWPQQGGPGPPNEPLEQWVAERTGLILARTTLTDDAICTSLVDELRLRGIELFEKDKNGDLIQPPQPKDHIAIVSEWDTFFGRALPLSFAAAATKQDISTFTPFTAQNFPENIHPFVYLRGIDGQTPGEPSASSNKESNKDTDKDSAGNATKVSAPGEAPEGLNQADYLRRLADQIAALDAKLRRRPGNSSGIRAIGILGSDVYDKLLVLRALRDRLPEPIFFTTAMDARYTLPSETVATHNLLVVSPFGLNLNETYQANIPSFRDSYQTAVFTASMWAVIGIPGDESHASNDPKLQLPPAVQRAMSIKQQMYLGDPRRFEIGLKGAHDLTVPGKPEAGILKFPRDEPVWKSFQPFREDYPVREVVLGGILPVALTLGILCLLALALGVRPDRNVMTDGCKFIVHMVTAAPFWLALAFIAVLVLWIQVDCWDGASGEPVALLDGVSIWPTESIRLLAFFLCFYFVAYCWLDAHKNDLEIRDEFDLKDFEEMETYAGNDAFCTTVAPAKSYWQWIKGRLWKYGFILCDWNVVGMPSTGTKTKPRVAEGKEPESADARVFAQNVWWEYQRRRKPWARGGRVLLLTLCYLLFTTALLNHVFAEPAPPVRGPYAHTVDRWIHWASLIASTALTFFVLDATYTNRRLIQYLLSHTTHWPPKAYDQCAWTKNPEDMTEYLDIRFIAKRTHAVGEVIYYPFVILFLLILARNSWFDDWKWSMGLIVVTALDFGLAITAALMLRGAAEEARRRALKKIRDRRLRCQDEPTAKKLSEVAELVENEQDGAFSILSRHPLLAAILLPSGTLGIWVLLEYVPKLFH